MTGTTEAPLLPRGDPVVEDVELDTMHTAHEQCGCEQVAGQARIDGPGAEPETSALNEKIVATASSASDEGDRVSDACLVVRQLARSSDDSAKKKSLRIRTVT